MGIREAFGVLGGGIAPFSAGLSNSPIRFYHFRHEAGAGFSALEAWHQTGRPGLVIVTTGPGLMNALNAVMAARLDAAKMLIISGFTSRQQAGRGAVQETTLASMPSDVLRPGSIFHDVAIPETIQELPLILGRIYRGFQCPGAYIAHLGLPLTLQTQLLDHPLPAWGTWEMAPPTPPLWVIDKCLEELTHESSVIWLGYGARGASSLLRVFAEQAKIPVICSPKAKGIFPESHELFIGVSGAGGSAQVQKFFATKNPRCVLVIGSRLGEVTTFFSPQLQPTETWIHVDLDASAFGAAFPKIPGLGIIADASFFVSELLERAKSTNWFLKRECPIALSTSEHCETLVPRANESSVRPAYLMQCVQRLIVECSNTLVMSEAGTSFTWCNSLLRFKTLRQYRTSAAWGSMGHFTTGCVGAALATDRQVVAIVGDGSMLMNNEISTAVQYKARVLWIILNDAQYGLNEHGMSALGMRPVETQFPRVDFVTLARSQGSDGVRVFNEIGLEAALNQALNEIGPFVVDVIIDRNIPSPIIADRIHSLQQQARGSCENL